MRIPSLELLLLLVIRRFQVGQLQISPGLSMVQGSNNSACDVTPGLLVRRVDRMFSTRYPQVVPTQPHLPSQVPRLVSAVLSPPSHHHISNNFPANLPHSNNHHPATSIPTHHRTYSTRSLEQLTIQNIPSGRLLFAIPSGNPSNKNKLPTCLTLPMIPTSPLAAPAAPAALEHNKVLEMPEHKRSKRLVFDRFLSAHYGILVDGLGNGTK